MEETVNEHWLPSKTYDFLMVLAQVILPALGTLYFTLAAIWGLPSAEQVIGTVIAVDTFLGVFLSINKAMYKKTDSPYVGTIDVVTSDNPNTPAKVYQLEFTKDPGYLDKNDVVSFKVNPVDE